MTSTDLKAFREGRVRFPDPPERTPDDMTSVKAIHLNGISHALKMHLADRPNTVIDAEHYISPAPIRDLTGVVYPDLLIAFDADADALERSNAYVISEQRKPPDFILEIASRRTRRFDRTTKRDIYARMAVPEYWRFDDSPTRTNPALAADLLVHGRYQPITIDVLHDGRHRGYSPVLNLILEWQDGRLHWIDPRTGLHIPTFEQERDARVRAEDRARAAEERARTAESRNRELEEENRRLRGA